MNTRYSDEEMLIQESAARFAVSELAPVAAKVEDGRERPLFLKNIKALAELGFMGINIATDYGGTGASTVAFSLAITEIAKACASTAVTTSVTNMAAEVIQSVGTEEQKATYLPKICLGEYAAASFCLTESVAGSDPSAMKARAVQDGNDWLLNGTKMWITSAEYAGLFIVWAVTDPEATRGKGISCFLVPADTPGISISPPEHKMGQKASSTCAVSFENCRVGPNALLGQINDGFRIAVAELAGGRIGIASLALGVGIAAMDYAVDYAKERVQFGEAIARKQGNRWNIADVYTELEAARLLTLNAAWLKDQDLPFFKEASMAKLFASEKANDASYTALQLAGGLGYTADAPLERYARDVRVTTIYEGTSEIQREIISREIIDR